jgi:hypothetical protein
MRRLDRFQIDLAKQTRPEYSGYLFWPSSKQKIETEDVYRQNDGNACYKWINQTVQTIGNQLPNTSFKVYQRRKKTANREKTGILNMWMKSLSTLKTGDWLCGSLKKAASLKILARYNIDA